MIALIIIGSVLLLIVFLLAMSVAVEVTYENDKFDYKVKYMFFTVFSEPESARHKRKREKRKAKAEKKEQNELLKRQKSAIKAQQKLRKKQKGKKDEQSVKATEKPNEEPKAEKHKKEKPKFDLDFEMVKRILSAASPHIKRIFKKIRIYDVYFDVVVGGDDAAKIALGYGKMNMLINGLLCFLDSVITLKVGEVNIEADFDKEKTDFFAYAKIKLRLSTLLHSVIWGYFAVMKEMNRDGSEKPAQDVKNRKAA